MAFLIELIGGGQACRPRSNYGYLSSCSVFWRICLNHSFVEGYFGNGCFVFANGYRCIMQIEYASFFARCRTNSSGEIGEIVCLVEHINGFFPLVFVDQVLPFGHNIPQRTAPVTKRYAAVHAARCLQLSVFAIECLFYFAEVVYSFIDGTIARFFARNRLECLRISHFLLNLYLDCANDCSFNQSIGIVENCLFLVSIG